MDKILYYPYISIPKSSWLNRALLYWDKVGSIVPYYFTKHPEELDYQMRELVQAELVTQIIPSNYLEDIPDFYNKFLEYIDTEPTFARMMSSDMSQDVIVGNGVNIHIDKMNSLSHELIDRKLAKWGRDKWIEVQPDVADAYMAYLAKVLGARIDYQAATDNVKHIVNFNRGANGGDAYSSNDRNSLRIAILDRIMPAPNEITDVDKLYLFKDKYNKELRNFRRKIEGFLLDIEASPSIQHEERINLFLEEAKDEIEELEAKMNENKLGVVSKTTLFALIKTGVAGLMGNDLNGGALLVAAINGAIAGIRKINENEKMNYSRYPFAYAMLINREKMY